MAVPAAPQASVHVSNVIKLVKYMYRRMTEEQPALTPEFSLALTRVISMVAHRDQSASSSTVSFQDDVLGQVLMPSSVSSSEAVRAMVNDP